jgi:hypothetical protein
MPNRAKKRARKIAAAGGEVELLRRERDEARGRAEALALVLRDIEAKHAAELAELRRQYEQQLERERRLAARILRRENVLGRPA